MVLIRSFQAITQLISVESLYCHHRCVLLKLIVVWCPPHHTGLCLCRSQSGERTPASDLSAEEERLLHADASAIMDSQECFSNQARVNAVPEWLKIRPNILALLIGIFFAIFSVITIGFYIYGAVALGSSD